MPKQGRKACHESLFTWTRRVFPAACLFLDLTVHLLSIKDQLPEKVVAAKMLLLATLFCILKNTMLIRRSLSDYAPQRLAANEYAASFPKRKRKKESMEKTKDKPAQEKGEDAVKHTLSAEEKSKNSKKGPRIMPSPY